MPPRDYYAALTATAVAVIANVAYWYYVRRRDTAELAAARAELATRKSRGERDGARAGVTFSVSATSGGGAKEPGSGAASPREPVRVYLDGCFDMLHYGHANALRQAKAAGDVLVVGLVNDAEIVLNKGSQPVMTEDERYAALVACKFVDEVIRDAPYNLHKDWVDELISKHVRGRGESARVPVRARAHTRASLTPPTAPSPPTICRK
jgi:cytidyltransferase-like protein